MRHLLTIGLLSSTLFVPFVAQAEQAVPSVEQIAKALSRPAVSQPAPRPSPFAGDPLQVTATMLKGPTRGIIPAQPAAVQTARLQAAPLSGAQVSPLQASSTPLSPGQASSGQASAMQVAFASATNPCPAGSGVCALYVEFETGSASLTTSAQSALDNLSKALASLQGSGFHFRVEGHTDTVGADAYNRTLSEQRADTVTAYLAEHFPIDRTHLEPVGMGKDHPLVITPDQTPEPRNRRVQVINLGA